MPHKSKPPTCAADIRKRVIHYGKFNDSLDEMLDQMRKQTSTSIIIRGNAGSGKKTLLSEVESLCDIKCIYMNPYHYPDDFSAMKHIATELKLEARASLTEILLDIEERSFKTASKIVIILIDFEVFCRSKQSLLYSLTNLTQHGKNISLVGLTTHLDCTEHLEKRVRSRLNALIYELSPPYSNSVEYIEFASQLLGGYKLSAKCKKDLKFLYNAGCSRSIRTLKSHLITLCSWRSDGRLVVKDLESEILEHPENDISRFSDRIGWCTKDQRTLLIVATHYCSIKLTCQFQLYTLEEFARNYKFSSFETHTSYALANATYLASIGLIKPKKPNDVISQMSEFCINFAPAQLRRAMLDNPTYHSMKTDHLWMKFK